LSKRFPKPIFPKREFVLVEDDLNYTAPSTYNAAIGSGKTTELWHVYYTGKQILQQFGSRAAAQKHLEYLILGQKQPIWKK
jgi:hypothetical protein